MFNSTTEDYFYGQGMKKELDESLCKEFPSICRGRFSSPVETPFAFGFECGEGWFELIRTLFLFIDNAVKNAQSSIIYDYKSVHKIDYMTDLSEEQLKELKIDQISVVVEQVKEKYGSLRVYVQMNRLSERFESEIDGAISFAEDWSVHVCETCGHPGKLRGPGWLFTACDEHSKGTSTLKEYQDWEDSQDKKKSPEDK